MAEQTPGATDGVVRVLLDAIAATALREGNVELAAYQVALHGADLEGARRARGALSEALDLYSRARALGRVLRVEAEAEEDQEEDSNGRRAD